MIRQGFAPDDTLHVPKKVLSLAKTKSDYERTKIQYDLAKHEYEQAELLAPFDGVVANLFTKEMNQPKSGELFCRIIGSDGLEVEFQVLESELPLSADPMIGYMIAKNYQQMGEFDKAEIKLKNSIDVLPERLYPYYLLTKLYADPGLNDSVKLRETASIVLSKIPKLESQATREMRVEIRKMLE